MSARAPALFGSVLTSLTLLAGLGLIDPLYQSAVKQGSQLQTPACASKILILNDKGRVIGVTATDKVGNKYEFTSKDGVILATGGYSQNKEMRQKSAPASHSGNGFYEPAGCIPVTVLSLLQDTEQIRPV